MPLGVRDQQGQLSLTCPTCRQVTPVPDRGVAGLQSAFHISDLIEIHDSVKNLQPPAKLAESATTLNGCLDSEHAGEEQKLFCETCGELVCLQCVIRGGKHHDHDYELLHKVFNKHQKAMEKQVTIIKKSLYVIEQRCGEISDQRGVIEDNIHATFKRLREILTVRETELIGQLHKMTQGKLKGLAAQSNQIETTLARMNSCLHSMREVPGRSDNKLVAKMNTMCQMNLITPLQKDTLEPNTEANMIFSALADMTAICQNYGEVIATIKEEEDRKSPLLLPVPIKRSPSSGAPVLEKLKTPIQTFVGMSGPCGVAITHTGEIVVTETDGHQCVSVFSKENKLVLSFGTHGSGEGEFDDPCGVAVDSEGNIIVADRSNDRIQKFAGDGKFLASYSVPGYPTDVTYNPSNDKLYVVSSSDYHILVLKSDLTFSSTFGTPGSGKGQFNKPLGLACGSHTGEVYVTDCYNHRIQVFTAEGEFLRMFGGHETSKPYGIAIDDRDSLVYVSDAYHRVCVFNTEGQFIGSFGTKGQGPGEYNSPDGIAVDNGVVYVCDQYNNRIQVF